jgi:pilus assembly protein CpaE
MRLMIVGLSDNAVRALRETLGTLVSDAGAIRDPGQLEAVMGGTRPEVVAIYLGMRPGQTLQTIRRVKALFPATAYIAIVDETGPTLIQSATEAGCADIVLLQRLPSDLKRSLSLLIQRDRPSDADGEITAILGAKGGMGTTTVAINLAAEIAARTQQRVILVDLHVYLGNVAVMLDIVPKPTVLWFLHHGSMADARTWADAPPTHKAGFRVLGLDGDVATADPITAEQVVFLCARLKERYEHVVLDCGAEFNEVTLAACSAANRRVMVTTDERTALVGAIRRRDALKALELGPTPARLVINRAQAMSPEECQKLADQIGLPLAGIVSNAWQDTQAALDQGTVLRIAAPRAQVTRDVKALVDGISGTLQEEERRKRTFFTFFR